MDLRQAAVALPSWEPFITRFRSWPWMREALGIETEDVQAECRWRALNALARIRARSPQLIGTVDEIRIVRRSIARQFRDIVRRANAPCRRPDHVAIYSLQAGIISPLGETPTLEEDYLDAERARSVAQLCEEIRAFMGDDTYADVLRVLDGDRIVGMDRRASLQQATRRRTAIRAVRRKLIAQPPTTLTRSKTPMADKMPSDLNDDDLARVGLVYKRLYKSKVTSTDRAHLLEKITAVNSDPDGTPFPFPPCFTDGKQYDPDDSSCNAECDFRVECATCIPEHRDAEIEAQLVQLKGGAPATVVTPAAPTPKAEKPKAGIAAAEQKLQAAEAAADAENARLSHERVENGGETASERAMRLSETPAQAKVKAEKPAKPAKVKAEKPAKVKAEKPAKVKAEKPAEVKAEKPAKVKAEKPAKVKAEKPAKTKARGRTSITEPVRLSTRPGAGFSGTVAPRLPQGSAAELAALPVGNKRHRDYQGVRYFVRKIEDGPMVTTPGGVERKRDGVWELYATAPIDENGALGARAALETPIVGSLGVITHYITKAKTWSASRFWSVIPPLLDPNHVDFNPTKWKPRAIYAYADGKPAKKGKRKAA